jgi:ubiquinone/menaquinone biosynthesis C-methylase UbiE
MCEGDMAVATETIEQKQKVTTFFDDSKPWQGDLYQVQGEYFARVIQRRKAYAIDMIRRLPGVPPGRVLDIGCGSGVYLEELLHMGFDGCGMDISDEMLSVTRTRLAGAVAERRLHLAQGDVEHIPFESNAFDLVICIGVFGYLLSDEAAIREILRVLKPGGFFLLNLTNMYSLSDADFVLRRKVRSFFTAAPALEAALPCPDYAMQSEWMLKNRKYGFKSYNLQKYERLLRGFGLHRIDAMTYGFEFRVLRRLKLLPERFLSSVELVMERVLRKVHVPYFSYSGWVYTGVFRKP